MPIQFTTTGLGTEGTVTRAANNINNTNFPAETPITVSVDGTNYSYKTDATSVSNPMVCQDATAPYFSVDGTSVNIIAYYPAFVQYATTAQAFVVQQDQSAEAGYKNSDLMVGLPKVDFEDTEGNSLIEGTGMARKVKRTSIAIPLEFEHKLVKITMNVTINGAVVKKITMKNIMRSIDFNPADGTLSNVAAVATTGLDNVIMYDNSTGTSTAFTCAAIIPEQDPTATTEFIDVVIQDSPTDKTLTYKLQEDGDFESGMQYIYNLTVNNDEILCTTTITDWDTAVDGANYTHGDGLALKKSIKLNPLWYVAEGNMTNTQNAATLTMGTGNTGYYYTWADAMSTFAASPTSYSAYTNANKTISGQPGTWHLPVQAELLCIVPADNESVWGFDTGVGTYKHSSLTQMFGYNSDTKAGFSEDAYWKRINDNELHAIRFLGTDYCSAWKYELLGGWSSSDYGYLRISATLIDKIENNADAAKAWYDSHKWSDADMSSKPAIVFANDELWCAQQRVFYARGSNLSSSSSTYTNYQGIYGYIWTATEATENAWRLHFELEHKLTGMYYGIYKTTALSVRLFRDN